MLRYRSFWLLSCLIFSVAFFSMSLRKKHSGRTKAVQMIAGYYENEVRKLDSSLAAYPQYFVDSTYELRILKYGELLSQFKKIEGLFTYYHPQLAYESFLLPARFQKRDFGPPFPDNWLWLGPFGIDPDSIMKKSTKQDSIFNRKFIER